MIWSAINISEGHNQAFLDDLSSFCYNYSGVELRHLDIGKSVNRSVFSLLIEPAVYTSFVLEFVSKCLATIDMTKQTGSHPRVGAVDVIPLVPIGSFSLQETEKIGQETGKLLAQSLGLSIFLYEHSQPKPHRKRLEQIRKGGYEQFSAKMNRQDWQPDYGPNFWNPKYGVTVLGVRNPLIAVNFSIAQPEHRAKKIARQIRQANKQSEHCLPGVKAIGWHIPEYGKSQISVNISDTETTSLKNVFDQINHLLTPDQIEETELIGLILKNDLMKGFKTLEGAKSTLKINCKHNQILDFEYN